MLIHFQVQGPTHACMEYAEKDANEPHYSAKIAANEMGAFGSTVLCASMTRPVRVIKDDAPRPKAEASMSLAAHEIGCSEVRR